MMRLLLVRPVSRKTFFHIPNLGLGYLAAQAKKAGHQAEILDCAKLSYGYSDFQKWLRRSRYDAVGFQVMTNDYSAAKTMVEMVKEHDPGVVTIVGGAHISGLPEYTLIEQPDIDYGFCGEAELGLPLLCDYLSGSSAVKLADIPGLIYRKTGGIAINPRGQIDDLDSLGWPDWDQIDPRTYPHAPHGTFTKAFPTAPLIATRGCPCACPYCSVEFITGTVQRARSPVKLVEEIEFLKERYGIKEVHLVDDNFTLDHRRVSDFCTLLIERRVNVNWTCPNGVRLDTLDAELLKLMERSGCYSFAVGIESGSPRILQLMGRRMSLETISQRVRLVASVTKIRMTGFTMLGYPGETERDMNSTVDLTMRLPLARVSFDNFKPLPGTRVFKQLLQSNEISLNTLDWDSFQENHIVYSPKGMSPQRLRWVMRRGYFRFYFRLRIILGLLREIHSWSQTRIILRRIIDTFF